MLEALQTMSVPQKAVLQHGNSTRMMMCAGGSIRSGKTFATMLAFAVWSMSKENPAKFLLAGISLDAVKRNVADDFCDILRELGFEPRMTMSGGAKIVCGDHRFYVVGANDEKAAKRIQGMTLTGAFLDEVVLLPKSFFMQAMARLSVEGAKCWLTYNPDTPGHWFKREVLDKLDSYQGYEQRFTLNDNPALPEDVKQRYRDSFTGHFAQRFVMGEWAASSGLIFPQWHNAELVKPSRYWLALDWGVSNVFAALLVGKTRDSTCVVREMYHDARVDKVRTEAEQYAYLRTWLGEVKPEICFGDPATPASFKRLIRDGGITWRNGDNNVEAGIRTTAVRLAKGDITISKSCENLMRELMSYQWDEKQSEQGHDAPVKKADHACDALRYFAHTTGKIAYGYTNIQKPKGM